MYEQQKLQGTGQGHQSTASIASCAQPRQVEGALDTVNMSLDGLLDVVNDLIGRLEPVTGTTPVHEPDMEPVPSLVPIAARIRYIDSRVTEMKCRLARALNAMEI